MTIHISGVGTVEVEEMQIIDTNAIKDIENLTGDPISSVSLVEYEQQLYCVTRLSIPQELRNLVDDARSYEAGFI